VLEIGCSTGETTRVLTETGAQVVAVDKSAEVIRELQEAMRGQVHVRVAAADGRDIPTLANLLPNPTLIFIDIGGDAHLDHVALQLRLCLRAFRPQHVVVRSFELAGLVSLIGEVETPPMSNLLASAERAFGRDPLSNLLELSYSSRADIRIFTARRLSRYDTPEVRDRLKVMISDPHPGVRRAARRAGKSLGIEYTAPTTQDEG
jgi:SAM-dependent methyltransferase